MSTLLALPGDRQDQEMAHNIASLPMRMGGLGLRRALRMAPAAWWASWADTLHMIHQRLPDRVVHTLSGREDAAGCRKVLSEDLSGTD